MAYMCGSVCVSVRGRSVDEWRVHLGTLLIEKIHFVLKEYCLCKQLMCDINGCLDSHTAAAVIPTSTYSLAYRCRKTDVTKCEYTANDKKKVIFEYLPKMYVLNKYEMKQHLEDVKK